MEIITFYKTLLSKGIQLTYLAEKLGISKQALHQRFTTSQTLAKHKDRIIEVLEEQVKDIRGLIKIAKKL